MKEVFVDTSYLIAILNSEDDLHAIALAISEDLNDAQLISSQEVLTEFLNYFSSYGPVLKQHAVALVDSLQSRPDFFMYASSKDLFYRAKELYANRSDKGYSLTDCISMEIARERGINEVLTYDEHFIQEGFVALLRDLRA